MRQNFSLMARNNLFEIEENSVSRFIGGLKQQIQKYLLLFNPTSVSEAHQRAVLIEQNLRGSSMWTASSSRSRAGASGETSHATKTELPPSLSTPDVGASNTAQRQTRTLTFKCFNCGEAGHRQANCPKCVLFGEDEVIYDDTEEEQQQTETEEQVAVDIGTILVVRRNCLLPQAIVQLVL